MGVSRDLNQVLVALRDRMVDPDRLAEAAREWSASTRTGFLPFLVERGVIAPNDLQRLESGTFDGAGRSTPSQAEDPDRTTDLPSSRSTETSGAGSFRHSDRYEVIRLHQSGGLGQVWLARDRTVGREVALKTLRPDRVGHAGARSRFVREARVTGQLQHPSIVPVHDLGGGESDPYYVMRFVSGPTLAEAAADYHKRRVESRAAPLDLNTLIDAFVSVCRAVAFAHSRNILHRDLKGQNIVVGEFGEVFLLDWGLAKRVGEESEGDDPEPVLDMVEHDELTAQGSAVGTPAYMAPEVAAGGTATKASDVYGLGAILYSLLAGRAPYSGNTAEILKAIAVADPVAIEASNPAVPPALAAIARRAMARNPADRYGSAEVVATEVRRWQADEPVEAYREPFPARAARWATPKNVARTYTWKSMPASNCRAVVANAFPVPGRCVRRSRG